MINFTEINPCRKFLTTGEDLGHMNTLKLAYRDDDRTPLIFCIKEMASRHYGVNLEVILIKPQLEFEAALFKGSCDVIIEHVEYLHAEAGNGKKILFFCAPQIFRGLELVVPQNINSIQEFRGKTIAVRALGRPYAVSLWLRAVGLDKDVRTMIIGDKEVGRWRQWTKVASGECIGCFVEPIYLRAALSAGLKTLSVPEIPVVSLYAQACLTKFAMENSSVLLNYVKAVIHAVCLVLYRRDEAMEIISQEPMKRMKINDRAELRRQVDCMARKLQVKPYPSAEAIINTHEIAVDEYGARLQNPLTLWDLHWVKQLDDEGFIDDLVAQMNR